MGRRPNYIGGGSIEYMHKGKHYDCRHRSEDGDCMNRNSQWFGEMCRTVGSRCKDYFTFNDDTNKTSKNKKNVKPMVFVPKKSNIVGKGDLVLFHLTKSNKDIEYIMSLNNDSIQALVKWAIGKTIGSEYHYKGNVYQIKGIKCRSKIT